MAPCHGGVGMMVVHIEGNAALGVEEVVFLINVKFLIDKVSLFVFHKFVIDSACLVIDMTVLQVAKDRPLFCDVKGGFCEDIAIKFIGI